MELKSISNVIKNWRNLENDTKLIDFELDAAEDFVIDFDD
jgi:hypothetical protein